MNIQTFEYRQSAVRIVDRDGAPWFVAVDIATILGYDHTPHMIRHLDDDEKGVHIVDTLGGNQTLSIISESGLYNAIFRSRRDEARAFRRWVTGTVLPAIRRTGAFSLADVDPVAALTDDAAALNARVAAVREARRIFGPGVARAVWRDLGLPLPLELAEPEDGLAAAVLLWIDGRDGFTNDELAAGIGLGTPDRRTRVRFGDILTAHGFAKRRQWRGRHHLAWCWFRDHGDMAVAMPATMAEDA